MKWPYRGFAANALWGAAWLVVHAFWYTTQGLGAMQSWFFRGWYDDRR